MKPNLGRVLIVDDETHSQLPTRDALEGFGFECDLEHDGADALKRISTTKYDAVVTELLLPNVDGGELVLALCSLKDAPAVVVHTRQLDLDVYVGLKNEGVDAVFFKPADLRSMAHSIQSLVQQRARRQQWKKATEIPAIQALRAGDHWIQESPFRIEVFRLSILFLASIIFALGWGNSLDEGTAGVCKMFGLCGLAFFFCLELVAYQRIQAKADMLRWSTERRLAQQLPA